MAHRRQTLKVHTTTATTADKTYEITERYLGIAKADAG